MKNLTPHPITLRTPSGNEVTIPPSGEIARVEMVEHTGPPLYISGEYFPAISRKPKDVIGLPPEGTPCLVSSIVLSAVPGRAYTYAPDTGESAIRDEQGHIVAVTRLVRA